MKAVIAALGVFFFAGFAHAGQLACAGDYFGYHFTVRANVSGTKISGKIKIMVQKPGFQRGGSISPSSSDIRKGQYIRFSGRAADGSSGSVNAAYNAGTGYYSGTLNAQSPQQGSVQVPVNCALKGVKDLLDDDRQEFDLRWFIGLLLGN